MLSLKKIPLLIISCAITTVVCSCKPIRYKVTNDNLFSVKNERLSKLTVKIEEFTDGRSEHYEGLTLTSPTSNIVISAKKYCVNAEPHYGKKRVTKQIQEILAKHIAKRATFKHVYNKIKDSADYYVTGKLTRFYAQEDINHLINAGDRGLVASGGVEVRGIGYIEIVNLQISNRNHKLIKEVEAFTRKYDYRSTFMSSCDCVYASANLLLKTYFSELIPVIESAVLKADTN